MLSYNEWLIERYGQYNPNNTIVVDVQPEYQNYIHFDINEFTDFLSQMLQKGRKVLYFYNGETIGSQDTPEEIINWLLKDFEDYDEYEYEEKYHLLNRMTFYDKGYAFFRSWMDMGIDESDIIKIIRLMVVKRISDSRDLSDEEIEQTIGEVPDDSIYLPHIDIMQLRQFNNAFLCGGGETACLREVQLMMNALNIKYKVVRDFVF